MDWRIELIMVPVTDVDRAKAFYVDQLGFHADHDQQVNEELRFVQLTPPSAASIAIGTGITDMEPVAARASGRWRTSLPPGNSWSTTVLT